MLSNEYGDANDNCQNEDRDGHTDGDQHFLLWEKRASGKPTQRGAVALQALLPGWGRTLTFRAFFWFSRAILTCSCPRST